MDYNALYRSIPKAQNETIFMFWSNGIQKGKMLFELYQFGNVKPT
jgi:hypothetical protein